MKVEDLIKALQDLAEAHPGLDCDYYGPFGLSPVEILEIEADMDESDGYHVRVVITLR